MFLAFIFSIYRVNGISKKRKKDTLARACRSSGELSVVCKTIAGNSSFANLTADGLLFNQSAQKSYSIAIFVEWNTFNHLRGHKPRFAVGNSGHQDFN